VAPKRYPKPPVSGSLPAPPPAKLEILDVWASMPGLDLSAHKGGGWVPSPHEPGVLVQYRDGGFR